MPSKQYCLLSQVIVVRITAFNLMGNVFSLNVFSLHKNLAAVNRETVVVITNQYSLVSYRLFPDYFLLQSNYSLRIHNARTKQSRVYAYTE
jgi:hypothetical protein